MEDTDLHYLIESALRTPEQFVERRTLNESAVLWQARAVAVAL